MCKNIAFITIPIILWLLYLQSKAQLVDVYCYRYSSIESSFCFVLLSSPSEM